MNLPDMPECTRRGECCGPVTATKREAGRIRAFIERHKIEWQEHPNPFTCGFYEPVAGDCRIYPVRPWACRAFGVIRQMPCPYFPEAAVLDIPLGVVGDRRLMDTRDRMLAEHFAPDGGQTHKAVWKHVTPEWVRAATKLSLRAVARRR